MKLLKSLSLLLPILGIFIWQPAVHADSYTVPLAVLENGSNSTSYAASYFANSATVTTNDNGYTVTSTITTTTDLGDYPVQMLSVDGGGVNVSKSASGNQQTITYSFTTNDIDARHNAVIKVDVNSINYHHTYTVGLQLDASSLPSLSTDSDAPALPTSSDNEAQTSSSTDTTQAKQSVTGDTPAEKAASTSSVSSTTTTKQSSSDKQSSAKAKTTSNKQATATNEKTTHKTDDTFPVIPVMIGGLSLGVIASLLLHWLKNKKK